MLKFLKSLYALVIDGQRFPVDSTDIRVTHDIAGGNIYAGGNLVMGNIKSNSLKISFEGGLASLNCNTAEINGNVTGDIDANTLSVSGNVTATRIDANTVKCEGDISARDIDANVVKGKTITKTK